MAIILALLTDEVARSRLERASRNRRQPRLRHDVVPVSDWDHAHWEASRLGVDLLVFDPYIRSNAADLDSCRRFRSFFPHVTLLPYGDFGGLRTLDVAMLARVGIRDVVLRGENDSPRSLAAVLKAVLARPIIDEVVDGLQGMLPDASLAVYVRTIASYAHRPISPGEAGKLAYCHPKTLNERLRCVGWPSLNKLLVWLRLFHAAHLMRDGSRSVEGVADALAFPSAAALNNQLRRYAGLTPGEVVRLGGPDVLLAEFRRRHRRNGWDLHGR